MAKEPYVYVSGAFTYLAGVRQQSLREFYEAIANTCRQHGLDADVPHRVSGLVHEEFPTAQQVDEIARLAVRHSCLVIAYAGEPSFDVGIEVEMAKGAAIPAWLLHEKGKPVSSLICGNPIVEKGIQFTDHADALRQIDKALKRFRPKRT